MAFTQGSVSVNVQATDPATFGLTSNVNVGVNETVTINFVNGTGANGFTLIYNAPIVLSGTTQVFNLGNSSLSDADGTAIAAARIKGVFLYNNGLDPIVLGAGTDPITSLLNSTGTLTLPPGAFFLVATPDATGWTVTVSTACNFTVTGTTGQTFQVIFLVSNS